MDYLAEAELLGPLLGDINAAGPRLAQVVEVTREVAQLATFHLAGQGSAESDTSDAAASVVRTGVERLDRALETLHAAAAELDDAIRRRFETLAGRLELHTVHRLAEKLPQYLRSQRGRRVMGGLVRIRRDASRLFVDQLVGLVYRRSEGMLLAGKIQRGARAAPLAGQRLAGFAERVSPAPSVLEKLPHYYRQLFLGRPAATGDLQIGFQRELAEADIAIDLHRRGHEGALLALGEQGQGRSTLCGLIAQRRATPDAIYRIDPPRGGSIDTDAFVRRLGAASRNPGPSPGRILDAFPPGSVLIINDLELWWERSPDGGAVLDLLDELIARAGPRLLILLNANPRAFALANRIRPMEERILRTIECEPFSARQLQEVVLLRHASTGLTFSLDGKTEEELSRLRLARLFDAHYDYSDGNIGVTLHAWISHIREIDGDLLRISAPHRPGLDVFEPLEPLQLMLLVQFVLHGALTAERLARITRLDGATLARETRSLVRAGLLVEDPRGDVGIDRFVYPHLVRFLARRELV